MTGWTLAATLTAALVLGFIVGWVVFSRLGVRSPNAWVTTSILLAGSVGGPAMTHALFGPTPPAYIIAIGFAGLTAGATFWPMGRAQGSREWL
ncbi:MAG TPA: hypothetical protein VF147_10410 [Vicinamibacterales bacterium]